MSTYKKFLFFLFLIIPFNFTTFGQITIGSTEKPVDGALLDLRNFTEEVDGATADKGLLLPRVQLEAVNSLNPLTEGDNSSETQKAHAAIIVYNVKSIDDLCAGLQVWDGDKWNELTGVEDVSKESLDLSTGFGTLYDRDGNDYPVANFEEAGWWMTTNLRTKTRFAHCGGTPIKRSASEGNPSLEAFHFTMNSSAHGTTQQEYIDEGLFYNTPALTNLFNTEKHPNGICPIGWHVPSRNEWQVLFNVLAGNSEKYTEPNANTTAVGAILKLRTATGVAETGGRSLPAREGGMAFRSTGYAEFGGHQHYRNVVHAWTSTPRADDPQRYYSMWIGERNSVSAGFLVPRFPRQGVVRCKKD